MWRVQVKKTKNKTHPASGTTPCQHQSLKVTPRSVEKKAVVSKQMEQRSIWRHQSAANPRRANSFHEPLHVASEDMRFIYHSQASQRSPFAESALKTPFTPCNTKSKQISLSPRPVRGGIRRPEASRGGSVSAAHTPATLHETKSLSPQLACRFGLFWRFLSSTNPVNRPPSAPLTESAERL